MILLENAEREHVERLLATFSIGVLYLTWIVRSENPEKLKDVAHLKYQLAESARESFRAAFKQVYDMGLVNDGEVKAWETATGRVTSLEDAAQLVNTLGEVYNGQREYLSLLDWEPIRESKKKSNGQGQSAIKAAAEKARQRLKEKEAENENPSKG